MHVNPSTTMPNSYRGRFAPSPTGPLHFGSLVTALASYLDARHHQGQWLVRIEDLDPPRQQANADKLILTALEQHGLLWDEAIRYQSQRSDAYQYALDQLIQKNSAFACQCSRRQLNQQPHRGGPNNQCQQDSNQASAWRLRSHQQAGNWHDRLQGLQQVTLPTEDVILKRRDGLWAYQLAVVIDDADQDITHVVRGLDLLPSTTCQQQLQLELNISQPAMVHLPIAVETDGRKLSKQNHARSLEHSDPKDNLIMALKWLRQDTRWAQSDLDDLTINELLTRAAGQWDIDQLVGCQTQPTPQIFQQLTTAPNSVK